MLILVHTKMKMMMLSYSTDNAKYIVEFYLRNDKRYIMTDYLPDMGRCGVGGAR